MKCYNWGQKDWPNFKYNMQSLEKELQQIVFNNGKYDGASATFTKNVDTETIIDLMVTEAIKTSEIEGEFYSKNDVLSSIKKNLGMHQKAFVLQNKSAENISSLMVNMRANFKKPLTKTMLFEWHSLLFANTKTNLTIGKWRMYSEPMQVISGVIGKIKVHFQAPPSEILNKEMAAFIKWFNQTAPNGEAPIMQAVIKAAIAHLYFLSIHPFQDGNGRIARALTEKVFAQYAGKPWLISLSYAIEKKRKHYYEALQVAQSKNEITSWLKYFVTTVLEAQAYTTQHINFTLKKKLFYDAYKTMLNQRQLKVIKRMLDEGIEGFKGGMNAKKYAAITKASKATATRDLQELQALGIFSVFGAGRSTSYLLVLK